MDHATLCIVRFIGSLLDVFQMAAGEEGLVSEYRSKLSAILF